MKLPVMAVGGLVVGILGGALTSGLGVKAEIMEARAQTAADSLAALERGEAAEGHEGVTVELAEPETGGEHGVEVDSLTGDPEAPAGTDSTAADPAHDGSEAGEAGPVDAEELEGQGVEALTGVANPAGLPSPASPASEPQTPSGGTAVAALNAEGTRKLAKIFGAMDPEDAAEVLMELTDEEVTAILVRMSDRVAAPVIAAFPAERAAVLTQAVLRDGGGGS